MPENDVRSKSTRRSARRVNGRRPRRRPERSESFAEILRGAAQGEHQAELAAWLAALEATVAGLEQTALHLRETVQRSASLWRALSRGVVPLRQELEQWVRDVRGAPLLAKRASATAWTLGQIALSYRLAPVRAAISGDPAAEPIEALHTQNAKRFYDLCIKHGGGLLKIGQLLSSRPDLLPKAWVAQLSALQDSAPAESWPRVRARIERELGGPLEQFFLSFEHEPIAAASIGQVYRAHTRDGRPVAVKVQRSGLRKCIELDMLLLRQLLPALDSLLPPTDYETIADELERTVKQELDYRREATSMARMHDLFNGRPGLRVPRPVLELCTDRILTSDYVAGTNLVRELDRLAALDTEQARGRRDAVMGSLLEVYFRQILEAGFFQADPHPGNFLVTDEGELVLLDFGCCTELGDDVRRNYLQLARAILGTDRATMTRLFNELGFETQSGEPDTLIAFADASLGHLRLAMSQESAVLWPSREQLLSQVSDLLETAESDPVLTLPPTFIMLGRVFAALGGLFTHYSPQVRLAERVLPILLASWTQAGSAAQTQA